MRDVGTNWFGVDGCVGMYVAVCCGFGPCHNYVLYVYLYFVFVHVGVPFPWRLLPFPCFGARSLRAHALTLPARVLSVAPVRSARLEGHMPADGARCASLRGVLCAAHLLRRSGCACGGVRGVFFEVDVSMCVWGGYGSWLRQVQNFVQRVRRPHRSVAQPARVACGFWPRVALAAARALRRAGRSARARQYLIAADAVSSILAAIVWWPASGTW